MEFLEAVLQLDIFQSSLKAVSKHVEVNGFDLSFSNINITGITSVTT